MSHKYPNAKSLTFDTRLVLHRIFLYLAHLYKCVWFSDNWVEALTLSQLLGDWCISSVFIVMYQLHSHSDQTCVASWFFWM